MQVGVLPNMTVHILETEIASTMSPTSATTSQSDNIVRLARTELAQ